MLQAIFSWNFLTAVIRLSTPLLFVSMAAVISGKADVLCIAFEGIMLFAAFGASIGNAWLHGVMGGLLVGVVVGTLFAVVFAFFVVYMETKPMLIGLALNVLGSGGTVFLTYMLTGTKATTSSLKGYVFPNWDIPVIRDIPILKEILSGHNVLTYLAFFSVFAVWFLLYKTSLGLRIRSVGENPKASQSVGINVRRTRFVALVIGGGTGFIGRCIYDNGLYALFYQRHGSRTRIYGYCRSEFGTRRTYADNVKLAVIWRYYSGRWRLTIL